VTLTIAVVQPVTIRPPDDEANVAAALTYIWDAADRGADLVCFPETYPGPWRMPAKYSPAAEIDAAARRFGIHVQYGTLEPLGDADPTAAFNVLRLAGPDDAPAGNYRRTHPPGPWIYAGGPNWDFEYVAGDDFPVFDTEHGTVGMAMCSEVYVPEVTRALAIRGAEIILLPAGLDKRRLWATWRNLIWSRAIENLAVVVTTQNMLSRDETGLAMVATPEEVIFESTKPGMFLVEVDLDRIRELRGRTDNRGSNIKAGVKTGVLSQWQRPELRHKFYGDI
jgi:predicted amidohydrolase